MIRIEQTNKLTLICDECGKKKIWKNETYIDNDRWRTPYFGEKGNKMKATKGDGWSIIKCSCRCPTCKGKPRSSPSTSNKSK